MDRRHTFRDEYFNFSVWLIPFGLAILLVLTSIFSFVLFHTLAELFAIIIAILMCVVAWQMYPFTKNNFLMYLGIGYFWIACLDLMHALSYKGLAILPGGSADTPIQIWIIARYFEALLLVSAPWFLSHNLSRKNVFVLFGVGAVSFLYLIVNTKIFPVTYIEGQGLTSFKVLSEYIIIAILIAAILHLKKYEKLLNKNIVKVMIIAIALTIGAELAFTYYVDVYGLSNLVGHIFKLFSFWLIFIAMVKTTLKEPFLVMSRGASTYDVIPDATIVADEKGIIHQANNAACELLNKPIEKIVGKNNHELFHPANTSMDDCSVCKAIENNVELRGLEVENHETGQWYDFTLSHIKGAAHLNGTVEVIRDITQRKITEDKISELDLLKNSIVENLPNMIFVKDANNLSYVEWNKAAEELTGLLKEEILENNDFDLWPKEEAQFFIDKDNQVIKSGEMLEIKQESLTTKLKGVRTLHTKKIPIYDKKGRAKYLLGISEDITEKLKTEEMLRRSQKMDAVGQMSGGIAHDFNNQLGVILGYTDLLSEQSLTDVQLNWIDSVKVAAQRCADLTKQLLIFSRSGEVDKEIIDINKIISDMEIMIQRTLTPEINIQYFLKENLWSTEVNAGGFKDIILNLVLNARDAMPDGGSLTIETSNIILSESNVSGFPNISNGEYIEIMLQDSGHGMTPEILEHVFEPFYTTKDVGEGTGLGLAMVYGFVRRYGGDILLESIDGAGATFRIYLPRSDQNKSEILNASNKDYNFPKGNESILVVDDEKALLSYAEQILKQWGYKVYCAETAAVALSILEHTKIDLLFTDVVMPGGISGYELAEKACVIDSKLKVLITSGFADKIVGLEKYAKYGFEQLSKPYDRIKLSEKLRNLLDE